MILHCQICSCQGTHISKDSAIATINTDKIALPLTPDMFTSVNPEREIPTPWLLGVNWQTMRCPRGNHLPWGLPMDDVHRAMIDGGPAQILTDEGLIDIAQIKASKGHTICPICDGEFQDRGFKNHLMSCERKNNG